MWRLINRQDKSQKTMGEGAADRAGKVSAKASVFTFLIIVAKLKQRDRK